MNTIALFPQMRRTRLLERTNRRASHSARVHVRTRNKRKGSIGSDRRERVQDLRLPGGAELREPLQPAAAGQDRQLLQGYLRRYAARQAA